MLRARSNLLHCRVGISFIHKQCSKASGCSFMRRYLPRGRFQQENARAHTAQASMQFLNQNEIIVLDWPSVSPDLSPIEQLWDELGPAVHSKYLPPYNVRDLRVAFERTNMP